VAPQTVSEQLEDLRRKTDAMQKLLDASRVIGTLNPIEATDNIVAETCRILNCDRATIFTLDHITHELVLCVAEGAADIRVPVGQGIAGTVAATGETINILDAYSDPRFSSSADKVRPSLATLPHTSTSPFRFSFTFSMVGATPGTPMHCPVISLV